MMLATSARKVWKVIILFRLSSKLVCCVVEIVNHYVVQLFICEFDFVQKAPKTLSPSILRECPRPHKQHKQRQQNDKCSLYGLLKVREQNK
jgi:hypothetical protein